MKLLSSPLAALGIALGAAGVLAVTPATVRELSDETWTVTSEFNNITAPGNYPSQVHLDLLAAGQIDDPYNGTNELKLRWMALQNWTYTSNSITGLSKDEGKATHLVFDGLDTYTTIMFCDQIVGTTDNQFRQFYFDVSSVLAGCTGDPVLSINFGSSVHISEAVAGGRTPGYPFEYPYREFVRKEQSDMGWDWGPAFVPCGPWKAGRIVQLDRTGGSLYPLNTNIDVYRLNQFSNLVPDQTQPWVVNASIDFLGTLPTNPAMKVVIVESKDASDLLFVGNLSNLTWSNMTITGKVSIPCDKAKLWWPRDMGPQYLYNMTIKVYDQADENNAIVLSSQRRIGFRTILLNTANVTEAQMALGTKGGNNWHFEINGEEFYAKGANMIPVDAFWPRVTQQRMNEMFDSIEAQNFNMVRFWASGIYGPDFMYDIADERGVLIWSEFQFSDVAYPSDDAFRENVVAEVTYNVRRLNHHASLAVWCGSNEYEFLVLPIIRNNDPADYPAARQLYEDLFIETFFNILVANSHSISYVPSSNTNGWLRIDMSPDVSLVERFDNKTDGDIYADTDSYNYNASQIFDYSTYPIGRFSNEFGFMSMPSLKSWQQVLDDADLSFNSSAVMLRNHHYPAGGLEPNLTKSGQGMGEMTMAVEKYYPIPSKEDPVATFGAWCHATQLVQADIYKSQIQFYRRGSAMPERQLGSLFWMINDIWQTPSWSALEYDGRWKVLGYVARRAYQHVISAVFWDREVDGVQIWVISDLWETVDGKLELSWVDMSGKPIENTGWPASIDFQVRQINATMVYMANLQSDLHLPNRFDAVLLLKLTAEAHLPRGNTQNFTHEDFFLPVQPNMVNLSDPGLVVNYDWDSKEFIVEARTGVSLYTWLEHPAETRGFFEDNSFVLVPGQQKRVGFTLHEDKTGGRWPDHVTIDSLWGLNH